VLEINYNRNMSAYPPGSVVHIGITGTRSGMTPDQRQDLIDFLFDIKDDAEGSEIFFHHGDCLGVDVEAADIAEELGYLVIAHPPTNDKNRAFHDSDVIATPKSYEERNHDIVNVSQEVFGVPHSLEEQMTGSGTWHTIRYAREQSVKLTIIEP